MAAVPSIDDEDLTLDLYGQVRCVPGAVGDGSHHHDIVCCAGAARCRDNVVRRRCLNLAGWFVQWSPARIPVQSLGWFWRFFCQICDGKNLKLGK